MVDQIVRSSRAIGNQIAEGHGKRTYPDKLRFTLMARGSLSETLGHLIDAFDCNYISKEAFADFRAKIVVVRKLMNGYISYLESKIPPKKTGDDK